MTKYKAELMQLIYTLKRPFHKVQTEAKPEGMDLTLGEGADTEKYQLPQQRREEGGKAAIEKT